MYLLFFNQEFRDILQALSWTLIHSLWEGLLMAMIAAAIIAGTKKSTAKIRYNLLTGLFLLFLLAAGITFFREINHSGMPGQHASALLHSSTNKSSDIVQGSTTADIEQSNLSDSIINYFNSYSSYIACLWFIFFLVNCLKLAAGLRYIHQIRNYKLYEVAEAWKIRLRQLSRQTGVRDTILLLESELVKMPVVLGYLKPMILVPAGLLSNLPSDQVEAILLHELAHILRKDYLINLLQSMADAVFFFNPSITWISSLIREEREACCDDIVLRNTCDQGSYLEALVAFQEYSLNDNSYVMGLGNKKAYLLNRVKRILTQENKKLNVMEKTFLLLGVTAITAFSVISQNRQPADKAGAIYYEISKAPAGIKPAVSEVLPFFPLVKKESPALFVSATADTTPGKNKIRVANENEELTFKNISSHTNDDGDARTQEIEATDNNGNKYRIKKINDELAEFSINGKPLPKEEWNSNYRIIEQIEYARDRHRRGSGEEAQRMAERMEAKKRMTDEMMMEKENINHEVREREQQILEREMQKKNEVRQREALLLEKMSRDNEVRGEELRQEKENLIRKTESMERMREMQEHQADLLREGQRNTFNEPVASIIEDLMNSRIIASREKISFTLTNNELIVNGSKQPAEVHQRLKEKYIKSPTDKIIYSRTDGTTTTTIQRN